ncbi:HAMP domain-containing methyl-accepting chemotaxis protein [Ferribacterium limneticum]|uniref:HAMP domain-containing methyl-accepting chemotaxis protein n=1 Tax=Ferribacterium limneticum TaxID=76259 RepID=UPI001CFB2593|nr:methyl-accepting chemotaxis protein [Ferribacterium limneticum]UCV17794.1 methyl-accepting chemotaxis protein [Ferribacterium limneticum]
MHRLAMLSIRQKLMLMAIVSLVSLAVVGFSGWLGVSRLGSALDEIQGQSFPALTSMLQARSDQMETVLILREFAEWKPETYESNPDDGLREAKGLAQSILLRQGEPSNRMDASFAAYVALPKTLEEETQWKVVKEKKAVFDDVCNELRNVLNEIANANDFVVARSLSSRYYARNNSIESLLTEANKETQILLEIIKKKADAIKVSAESSRTSALTVILVILILAGAGLAGLTFLIVRTVVGSLESMRREIVRVADTKDFTSRILCSGNDELAQTAEAFNGLLDTLQSSLKAVLESALGISKVANDSATAASRVLEASTQQSEAALSMAASIEQMTVGINLISDNAKVVMGRSREASEAADMGARTINGAAQEMDTINQTVSVASETIHQVDEQSSNISAIISVIKDVAEQTNLLALNAAIEAARAGEQGRGFAVVADEVRKLAERTSKATAEISAMIVAMQSSASGAVSGMQLIVGKVKDGKDLSSQASHRMNTIQANSDEMALSINQISDALSEQSASAQEISRKVEVVAQMSEENCEVAAETARISKDLKCLSEKLHATANLFRV